MPRRGAARDDGEDYQAMKDAHALRDAAQRSSARNLSVLGPEVVSEVTRDSSGRLLDHWQLWFPARLGPPRKATVTVVGHKIKTTRQRMDLPPTMNDTVDTVPHFFALSRSSWSARPQILSVHLSSSSDLPESATMPVMAPIPTATPPTTKPAMASPFVRSFGAGCGRVS